MLSATPYIDHTGAAAAVVDQLQEGADLPPELGVLAVQRRLSATDFAIVPRLLGR